MCIRDRTLDLDRDGEGGTSSEPEGQIITASLWQARQPVYEDSVERWRHYEKQLAPLLETLAPILD